MFKKFGILGALSELLEPHFFGRTGALKFGTIGVHLQQQQQPSLFQTRNNKKGRQDEKKAIRRRP